MKIKPLLIASILGLGLTLAMLGLPVALGPASEGPGVARADGPVYCVTSGGGSFAACKRVFTNVQAAVDAAAGGEEIRVAAGRYTDLHTAWVAGQTITQVVYVNKSVTIRGGYTTANAFAGPPDPEANLTTLDAGGQGRVLYVAGDIGVTIEGVRITGGKADGSDGGGLYVVTATLTLSGSQVLSNTAYAGGGLALQRGAATLTGNIFTLNTADLGGGAHISASTATLRNNEFTFNTAQGAGGGLRVASSTITLSGDKISANSAATSGGGLQVVTSTATLNGVTLYSNQAEKGGGLFLWQSTAALSGNAVTLNDADYGGGVYLADHSVASLHGDVLRANAAITGGGLVQANFSVVTLTNAVIADNRLKVTSGRGAGVLVASGASSRLLHTTIARNGGGDGSGVYVAEFISGTRYYSRVTLTNTILVGQAVGITVTAGNTASMEATLWGAGTWAHGADWGGEGVIVTGTRNVWGDPAFVNPDGGDYHLGPGSAALDVGVDANIRLDMDGETRPAGAGYDVGADELIPGAVDLDVLFIKREPKYNAYVVEYPGNKATLRPGTENDKRWPDPGEVVTFTAAIANKGTESSDPFAYTWYIDGVEVKSGMLDSLAPGSTVTTTYQWVWAHRLRGERLLDDHTVRFVADPANRIAETFEVNNRLEDRTNALSWLIVIHPAIYEALHTPARPDIPRSAEDWFQKQVKAFNEALAGSTYPFLPEGATERVRIDEIITRETKPDIGLAYDGSWFVGEDFRRTSSQYDPATDIDWGFIHEMGHQLGLIDLYKTGIIPEQIKVLKQDGTRYQGPYLPAHPDIMGGGDTSPHSTERLFSSHSAGAVTANKGYRRGYYGEYQYDLAPEIWIEVRDAAGYPVEGVTVSLYQRLPLYQGPSEEIDNIPEIVGVTDDLGRFRLPNRSVGGALTTGTGHTLRDNPFGVIDVVGVGNAFLMKFNKDGYEDFQWLSLQDLNLYYWANNAPASQTILHRWNHPVVVKLVNGDFEGGFYPLAGQCIANGWAPYTLLGQPTFAGERSTVHGGRWAYKVAGYAPFIAGLAQQVSVQPGRTYRVTAYYQLYPPGDGSAFLGIQDGASPARWVGDNWPGVWRPLSQTVTATSNRLIITLQGVIGLYPNTNVYFDDVTVVAVDSP